LIELKLGYNKIGNDGVEYLVKALEQNKVS